MSDWLMLPIVLTSVFLGVQLSRWSQNRSIKKERNVSDEYFKGLNFLLNEQPDKAIEVFIKALEVDSETVELHLALGGLFRRKGQVDRATRIHQNLVARPSLTEEQRLQAIYELAQDYYKAGLLDRAENLYLELQESASYRYDALEGLCRIYQQEKDWARAIEVSKKHRRHDRANMAVRVSHFWCELAEQAIEEQRWEEAKKYLRSALSEHRGAGRAVLLHGELNFRQQRFRRALEFWESLQRESPVLANLVVGKSIKCYQNLGNQSGLRKYLLKQASLPRDTKAFLIWYQCIEQEFGKTIAQDKLIDEIQKNGLTGSALEYMQSKDFIQQLDSHQESRVIESLLTRAKHNKIEYTCGGCGFHTKAIHWLCPNCGQWDSFK